jgi:hypothetical protein
MQRRKRIYGLAVAAVVFVSSLALLAPPVRAAANAWVKGYVLDSGTGTPIANASVYLDYFGEDYNSTITNGTGYFWLGADTPFSRGYTLTAFHPGYFQNSITITLDIGVNATNNITIDPATARNCGVYGRVRDGLSGANISGESVVALSGTYVNGTTTGPGGGYWMKLIANESYVVEVTRTGYETARKYIDPRPGQNLSVPFWLEPVNCTVRGIVYGSGGSPLTSAYVTIFRPRERANAGDIVSQEGQVDGTGAFSFNVSRGVWHVSVQDSNNGHYTNTLSVIAANGRTTWQNFTMAVLPPSSAVVGGYITYFTNGTPAEGAMMTCGNQNNTWVNASAAADSFGYYYVYAIPGKVNFAGRADGYTSNMTTFDIAPGGSYWLNVTLSPSGSTGYIEGYVLEGATPLNGAHVATSYGGWRADAWTDNLGHYVLDAIPAPLDIRFTYGNLASSTVSLAGPESGTAWVNATLSALDWSGELRGIVKDNFNVSIEKATVYLGDEGSWSTGIHSDYTGLYQRGVPSNNASCMMFAAGYEYVSASYAPSAGDVTWANATLKRVSLTSTLRIRLTAPRWGAVERAHLTLSAADKQWWLDAETDSSGESVVAVPPGKVLLSFDAWANGFVDIGQMAWQVAPSKTRWLNITLFPRDLNSWASGHIQNATGDVSGAFVFLRFGDTYYNDITGPLGLYNVSVPSDATYSAVVSANGHRIETWPGSTIVQWSVASRDLTLQGSPAWLVGLVQTWFRDTDAVPDGKYDSLQVNLTVDVAVAGEYRFVGDLAQSRTTENNIFSRSENKTELAAGIRNVTLTFPGPEIYNSRKDGYFLKVRLQKDGAPSDLDWTEMYTPFHRWSDFDAPVAVVEPPYQRWLVDTDFDGLYNMLVVNVTIDCAKAGNYTLIGSLNDIFIKTVDQAIAYSYIEVSTKNLQLQFSGAAIRRNGKNIGFVSLGLYEQVPTDETGDHPMHTHYFYAPYDYMIFQMYPSTANVSGTVRDETSAPIKGITVTAYNVTHRYLNTAKTNAAGMYTVGCFPGDWLLVIDDAEPYGDSNPSVYQGNLTVMKGIALAANVTHDVELKDAAPNDQWGRLAFGSWNETRVESMMTVVSDNETFRFMMDVYNVGDGDGYLSEEESAKLLSMIGWKGLDNDSREIFRVDGLNYSKNATVEGIDLGITGYVWSREPAFMHMTANYEAPSMMAGNSHILSVNCSYDGTSSDGGDNSTYIDYMALPYQFARVSNDAIPNITVSGTDYVTIDPRGVPPSGNTSAWMRVTCSKPSTPSVCSIKGWVDLQGTIDESGVLVSSYVHATHAFVTSSPTNSTGYYEILGIPPNWYDVMAHKAGYLDAWLNNSYVGAGGVLWCNFTLLSPYPPTIVHTPLTTLMMGEQFMMFADVTDDRKVAAVSLNYTNRTGAAFTLPMSRLGVSSTYYAILPAQAKAGYMWYYIWASDSLGNFAAHPSTGNHTLLVYELAPPTIGSVQATPNPAEYPAPVTVSAQVADGYHVAGAWLNVTWPGGGTTNVSMVDGGGDLYYFQQVYNIVGAYSFTIWANDSFDNWNHVSGSFAVQETIAPSSSVNAIGAYWHGTSPLVVAATASDAGFGVANVTLWYRRSPDNANASWSAWYQFGVDTAAPYSWGFDFPAGQGHYEFATTSFDANGNQEALPATRDACCGYDTAAPSSSVTAVARYWRTTSPLTVWANGSDALCGVGATQLWYSFSQDNATWGAWTLFSANVTPVWRWYFNFPGGNGHYRFHSIAVDNLSHAEAPPPLADAECGFDNKAPAFSQLAASPSPCELGQAINVSLRLADIAGTVGAWASVTFGGALVANASMSRSGTLFWYRYTAAGIGLFNATIWTRDVLGFTNRSWASVTVRDTTAPSITGLSVSPDEVEVPGAVNVSVTVADLGGVAYCTFDIADPSGNWLSNDSMARGSSGLYSTEGIYPLLGDYDFVIWAVDGNGNAESIAGSVVTVDSMMPTASAGISQQVVVGTTVMLDGSGSADNYGIANLTWTFNDNGARHLYGAFANYTFVRAGSFEIGLAVDDFGGNQATTRTWVNVTPRATTGSIAGTVLTSGGRAIPGARVYVDGTTIENATDSLGRFLLVGVNDGAHTVIIVAEGYERASMDVTVVAGGTVNAGTINLTSSDEGGGLVLLILLIVITAAVLGAWFLLKRKRRRDGTVIDELFLMYNDGRLMKHFTRRLKPDMDTDILSSMLVAVQEFVKDSFRGEEGGLDEMKFGRFQILLGRGEYIIIAALMMGEELAPYKPQIAKCIKEIEAKHVALLKGWDGDIDKMTPLQRQVQDLIEGKYA